MSKAGNNQAGKGALVSLLVFAMLLALLVVGCSSGGGADQKAMRETVGKFYTAQGGLDLPGMKAALYDPQNLSGIATATVPPGSQKAEVDWKHEGDKVVITIPSQELTLTVSTAKTPANAVILTDPNGQADTLIMKKDGGAWKIDVAETQKANAAKSTPPSGQGAP